MKSLWTRLILLALLLSTYSMASTKSLIIDDFQDASQASISKWNLVEDGVMGGVSNGQTEWSSYQGRKCLRLNGLVSTANNGGFIQTRRKIDAALASTAAGYSGIEILVAGNNEEYNLHLKQKGLLLPWQSFRATFRATEKWQTIRIPFEDFQAYRTFSDLRPGKINQVALVAIGRDFEANVCLAYIGLYH